MLRLVPVMVLFIVGACGTDLTADKACSDIATARCVQLMTCSSADLAKRWPDLATCEAREKLACTDALGAPATASTPSTVDACSSALATQTCDAALSGVAPPTACLTQAGPAANGAACAFAAQCASAFCSIATSSSCGVCATSPVAGDSCAAQSCGQTLVCSSAMVCVAPVALAGSCSKSMPCGVGLSCVGSTTTTNGTCMAEGATAGVTCDPRRMTGAACNAADGLTCDTATNTCVTQPLAQAGQPCGLIGTTVTACGGGATCEGTASSSVCVAAAVDGAACDAVNGPACEFPARCVANTCQLPGAMACK